MCRVGLGMGGVACRRTHIANCALHLPAGSARGAGSGEAAEMQPHYYYLSILGLLDRLYGRLEGRRPFSKMLVVPRCGVMLGLRIDHTRCFLIGNAHRSSVFVFFSQRTRSRAPRAAPRTAPRASGQWPRSHSIDKLLGLPSTAGRLQVAGRLDFLEGARRPAGRRLAPALNEV